MGIVLTPEATTDRSLQGRRSGDLGIAEGTLSTNVGSDLGNKSVRRSPRLYDRCLGLNTEYLTLVVGCHVGTPG